MEVTGRGTVFSGSNCAFTSTAVLQDGSILVTFRHGSGRDSPDGHLRLLRSRDGGLTWEPLAGDFRWVIAGYLRELAPGRLAGAFLWVDRSNPALPFVNPQTQGLLPMRVLLAESPDGGGAWGPFRHVSLAPHPGASVTGPLLPLAGGSLGLPYECWKEYGDASPARQGAYLRLSPDGGRTWDEWVTVARHPEGRVCYWDQRLSAEPETGRLVAMFWTHDAGRGEDIANHIAYGSPDGRTWTAPVPTPLLGQHCQPLALGGGWLLAVYVHRRDPPSLRAALSHDMGATWAEEVVFYASPLGREPGMGGRREMRDYWADMERWRFGHPRARRLPDGQVFIAYHAGDDVVSQVHWVRLAMQERKRMT